MKDVLSPSETASVKAQTNAFDAYVTAQALAKETLSFDHAHEAGRAWARFIDLYLPADRRLGAD